MEYFKSSTGEVYAYDPETQQELIDEAIANGWENVTGSWPPPQIQPAPEKLKPTVSELQAQLAAIQEQLNELV